MATVEQDFRVDSGSAGDIDAVMAVMDSAFGERFGEAWTRSQLAGILPMAGVSLVIARDWRTLDVIGFSLFRTVADEAELLLLGVLQSHHRRGVGRRLLDEFLQRAGNEGVSKVHLEVRDGNPAIAMYCSVGFSPVGRRRNYYQGADGRRFDAITLATQL